MKKGIYAITILLLVICSCHSQRKEENKDEEQTVKVQSKLEQLLLCSKDSTFEVIDLSNDSIATFPDLSGYNARHLNLSYNQLDTLVVDYLPQGLIGLNLSHNNFKELFWMKKNPRLSSLKDLDISNNNIKEVAVDEPLRQIIASYNDLIYINFSHRNIQYLDISYNVHLDSMVDFVPKMIDTLLHEGVAGGSELQCKFSVYRSH